MDGAEKLVLIGKKLRAEANGPLRRRVGVALRAEARPLARKTADRAREVLPKAGGLNELVAGRHVTISVLTGANTAGVRMRKKDAASYQTNRGFVSHKTYGDTPWQRLMLPEATGWWTKTLTDSAHEVVPALKAVIDKVAVEIGAI